jgi:hypothetical protein
MSLKHNGDVVTNQEQIRGMIYNYYKQLFSKQPERHIKLKEGLWDRQGAHYKG